MIKFRYVALDRNGQRVVGALSAPNRATALRILSENYPVITALNDSGPGWRQRIGLQARVSNEELVAFTQTLATLLEAGLTLRAALDLLGKELRGPINPVVIQLGLDLGGGEMVSAAMARHPQVFDKLYRNLVLAGETGGKLPQVLARLGEFLARSEAMRDRLRAATVYPAIVLTFALVVLTLVMAFVVPQLETLYAGLSSHLPWATQALINCSRFLGAHLVSVTVLMVVAVTAMRLGLRTEVGSVSLTTSSCALVRVATYSRRSIPLASVRPSEPSMLPVCR